MAQHKPNNLRIVLIGGKQSGKTSAINTILGKKSTLETARCQKREGVVNGLELTLVDTPGYWRDLGCVSQNIYDVLKCYHGRSVCHLLYLKIIVALTNIVDVLGNAPLFLCDTAEFIKHELRLSLTLCPPGPHAVVLVVELDIPFTEEIRCIIQEHAELLGKDIWKHAIVLFTRRRSIETRKITTEEHIESEGQALCWLIDKCERRYLSFENEDQKDATQVIMLLEKIQKMAATSGHFVPDWVKVQEIEERRRLVIERAMARQYRVKQQRDRIQHEGDMLHLSEVRIVIVGWVFSGKSAAANTLLMGDKFPTSCWTETSETRSSKMLEGQQISVTDTPGWFKYFPIHYNPPQVTSEIKKALTLGPKRPHAILLVVPLGVSFLEQQQQIMQDNMESRFGEDIWRHTIVLFTWGDLLEDMSVEEHIESEGEPLRWLVEKCRNRYHVLNNENRGDRLQVTTLLKRVEEMVTENHLFTPFIGMLQEKCLGDFETDSELNCGQETTNLKKALEFLTEEWKRDDEEIKKMIHKAVKNETFELVRPNIHKGDEDIEHPLLDRESRRHDCIKIKRILDFIEAQRLSSECDSIDIERSKWNVWCWLLNSERKG